MAWMATGLTWVPGSEPPDQVTAVSPVRAWKKPSAICERPALWVHRNNTTTSIVAHMTNNMPGAIGILFLL